MDHGQGTDKKWQKEGSVGRVSRIERCSGTDQGAILFYTVKEDVLMLVICLSDKIAVLFV